MFPLPPDSSPIPSAPIRFGAARFGSVAVGLALALSLAGCWRAEVPVVPEPPGSFVRYPYLQAVTDSSAQILWVTETAGPDTVAYWLEDGAAADTVRVGSADARVRHRVVLAPLPPDATVGYRVGGSERPAHRFRTAPRVRPRIALRHSPRGDAPRDSPGARRSDSPAESPSPFTALVFGDSGLGSEAQVALARRMDELSVDLILHTGDVAYPDGTDFDLTYRHFRVYRDLLARAPFFPAMGNHDAHTDGGRPFERAFTLPEMPATGSGFFGSFDWGPLHVVVLDSTGDADDDSAANLRQQGGQYRWLEGDLQDAAGDPGAPWIVVVLHHPPYSSGTGLVGHGSDEELRRALTPLFDRYGVDLVLTGHDHHYERSFPIRGGVVDSDTPGTVYVVTGGGGGSLRWRAVGREWHAAVTAFEHHFLTLEVAGSHLTLRAIGHDGEVIDQHEIRPVPPF